MKMNLKKTLLNHYLWGNTNIHRKKNAHWNLENEFVVLPFDRVEDVRFLKPCMIIKRHVFTTNHGQICVSSRLTFKCTKTKILFPFHENFAWFVFAIKLSFQKSSGKASGVLLTLFNKLTLFHIVETGKQLR